jgi:hypothetical protein
MKRDFFQSGDVFVYPENKKCLYILTKINQSYIAVDLRYGLAWDNPTTSIKDAVKGLEFYKFRGEAKITVE